MTDNEIIKALEEERAMLDNGYSTYLMYGGKKDAQMEKEIDLISNALDLINRQQAEIERLNNLKRFEKFICERIHTDKERNLTWIFATKEAEQEAFEQELEKLFDISTTRAEAIKEFAERLKKRLKGNGGLYSVTTMNAQIDNLVKEMIGE